MIKLQRFLRSQYFRNAAVLVSGTAFAQVISVLAALVLARIYSPGFYSLLTVYMSVSGLAGALASLQFHNVIVITRDEAEVGRAVNTCVFTTCIVSVLSLLLVLFFINSMGNWLAVGPGKYWLLLTPVSVFFTGLNYTLSALASRRQKYKLLSFNRIFAALLVPAVSITLGLILKNEVGLFAGLIVSQVLPALLLMRHFRSQNDFSVRFSIPDIRKFIGQHKYYPLFSLPADFINNLVNQLPVFMLTRYYNGVQSGLVGHYGRSTMLLGMPVYLVSSAVGEVFRQKASAEAGNPQAMRRTLVRTGSLLFLLSIVPFALIFLFGPSLFRFALGSKWGDAGEMASALSLMFALRFTISPLTYVYYIARKQREDFLLHIVMVLVGFLSFFLANRWYPGEYLTALWFYGIAYGVIYIVYLVRSYQFCSVSAA
ncbi:MAG: oligosaccharide flippase family protein [Dinghuibacter sp.]|nr:oligosaccharide flippase family protein [Dinghuibacter sp.]